MTEAKPPTAKQWQRRALAAEKEVAMLRTFRSPDGQRELARLRELAGLRVALAEIREVAQWAADLAATRT